MNKLELKEKELKLREEKLRQARERLEFKKEVWNTLKNTVLTKSQAEFIRDLVK
jgi:hypothetical protein